MSSEYPDDPYATNPGPGFRPAAPGPARSPAQPPTQPPTWSPAQPPAQPPPGRGRLIAIIAGLGVLGLLVGVGAGVLADRGDDTGIVAAPAETATAGPTGPTVAPVVPATTTAGATPSTGPVPASSSKNDLSPLPEHPETVGADFGYVVSVSGGAQAMKIVFDRAQFRTGGDTDYTIENVNKKKRTFGIDPRAGLVGTARLNNENGVVKREVLAPEVFLDNLRDALEQDGQVPVWLRHANGLEGTVTALSEQYLP